MATKAKSHSQSTTKDYSRMRKGTAVTWYKGRVCNIIDYCPVCGKKGKYSEADRSPDGYEYPITVRHLEQRTDMGIGIMCDPLEECTLYLPFQELINSALSRYVHAFMRGKSLNSFAWRNPYKRVKQVLIDDDWPAAPYIPKGQ